MNRQAKVKAIAPIGHEWRRWIAENLMLGTPPDALVAILVQNGIGAAQARTEVELALQNPYLHGARRLANRLAKRDWVLAIGQRLAKLGDPVVPRRERLQGSEFLQQYYAMNRPAIITGMLRDFPALTRWNLDYFAERFADRVVEVQFGRSADRDYEMNSIAHKRQMRFGDYVDLVRSAGTSNDFYMTANNDSRNREALHELWDDLGALPEYLDEAEGRQGFFWFGPEGTITPFHHDLTNNFMMQIVGRKKVRLMAPWDTPRVYNHQHCFTAVDANNIDLKRFPAMADVPVLECVLEPGEILFLPVGWWHHVEALDMSVTIAATNFKWPNDFYTNYPSDQDF